MKSQNLLPKRVVDYIHEIAVRTLDHLAANAPTSPAEASDGTEPDAVQILVDRWKSMADDDKEEFVNRIAASVIEVVAASATLPLGLKLTKEAAKATKKALKRQKKKLRHAARRASAAGNLKKKSTAKAKGTAKDKPKNKPASKSKPKIKDRPKKKNTG